MTSREALESLFGAWRAGDALRSAAHFSLDGTYREAGRPPLEGREAILAHFTRFFRDGPLWEFFVDDLIVEGERAAIRYRFTLARTGAEPVERAGCAFATFADGTLVEWREYEG